jgi:amino acid transporter
VVAALLLLVGSISFHHRAGFHILVATERTTHTALWYGFILAALLPMYCFIGWEGAADLAEETNDPRAVTPYAMIRANLVSMAASVLMIVGFLVAIPRGIADLLGQSKNPLIYIFQSHFGAIASDVLQVVVFLAIFSCVLANMVVATRLAFALSRDRMLPGSNVLGSVNKTTRTPIASVLLVAAVGIGINLLSAGIAANVVSICSVAYYFVYLLTVGGATYAHFAKKMPGHRSGDFSLGRWFIPVAVSAGAFTVGVVVIALAPQEGHVAARYLFAAEVIGLLWYLCYLRPRLVARKVGIYRDTAAGAETDRTTAVGVDETVVA